MKDKILKRARVITGLIIIIAIAWLFILKPRINFSHDEDKLTKAAQRYFELNSNELPSGERVKTLTLQKIYDAGLLDKDFYIPLSKKTCSNENSWVKVRRENGEYKYYTYLECGYLKSTVDHEGPEIILNGKNELNISRDTEYKELGVKSVVDKEDGNLKTSDVVIKGNVDTSKTGTYEITYTAFDKLSNKTVVTRKVNVVRKIYDTVKKDLKDSTNYKGEPENNYVRLSNMVFRIYGYDENKNIILIADTDISNINYIKIDEWLKYYSDNLNEKTKDIIVEKKYCAMTLDEKNLNKTKCEKYTSMKKIYIPSIVEVNNAQEGNDNFMKPSTMSWVAESKNKEEAYVTRDHAYIPEDFGVSYFAYNKKENYGIRPMFTIKGKSLIVSGDGTVSDPYTFGDVKKGKGGDLLNTRHVGEFVTDVDNIWRIVKVMDDGTTKVISTTVESSDESNATCYPTNTDAVYIYNPKDKKSVGYCINNAGTKYYDVSKFDNHEIEVPIYKKEIIYGKEIETKKYKSIISAPNMYEMFSAATNYRRSYWLINSSKAESITGAITEIGVPVNGQNTEYLRLFIRPVGFYKKDVVITSGDGTEGSPYMIR